MAKEYTVHPYYTNVDWGMRPYDKQQEILDYLWGNRLNKKGDEYTFLLAVFGRQSGKSWLAKYGGLQSAIMRGWRVMWVSPTSDSARTQWNGISRMIELSGLPVLAHRQQTKELDFYGGGSLLMRSALSKDGLRGDGLDLIILDESAFYRDGESIFYSIILPMITATRGKLLFTTTPNGRNWVYPLFNMGLNPEDEYYKSWHMRSMDSPYQDKRLLKQLKKTMPIMQWKEEFEAEFLSDAGGVFAGVDDASVVPMHNEPLPNRRYSVGVDWGDVEDYSVFTVIDIDTRQQVFGDRFTGIGTQFQLQRIFDLLNKWKPEVAYVERNGMGHTYFRMLEDMLEGKVDLEDVISGKARFKAGSRSKIEKEAKHGKTRVIGVHVDNKEKREMVERIASAIEYGRLELLAEDTDDLHNYATVQKSEMSTYTRTRTANGVNVTYQATDNNHDDTVSALMLAYRGIPKPKKVYSDVIIGSEHTDKLVNPFRVHTMQGYLPTRRK